MPTDFRWRVCRTARPETPWTAYWQNTDAWLELPDDHPVAILSGAEFPSWREAFNHAVTGANLTTAL